MSEEGHAIIIIVRPIDKKDLVAFRSAEFRLLFGNGWEQIWKGKLVHPKPGYEGVISYSYSTDTVEIGYETDAGEQVPTEVTRAKLYCIFTFLNTVAPSVLKDCFSGGRGKQLKNKNKNKLNANINVLLIFF